MESGHSAEEHARLRDALADAKQEVVQLREAMENRTLIGQAQGIVMERLQVSSDQAFEYLRRVSSYSNRKVIDIARDIATTRELPDLDR